MPVMTLEESLVYFHEEGLCSRVNVTCAHCPAKMPMIRIQCASVPDLQCLVEEEDVVVVNTSRLTAGRPVGARARAVPSVRRSYGWI